MIKIIDNALPESIYKSLKDLIYDSHFPWYLNRDIEPFKLKENSNYKDCLVDDKTISTLAFVHTLTRNSVSISKYSIQVNKIINLLIDGFIVRSKFNCLVKNSQIEENKYNVPHVDVGYPHYSFLLYLNESDGDTTFFNEYGRNKRLDKVNILKKVSPKENRVVISDGQYHASSNPIKYDMRMVLNAVIKK